MFRDTPGWQVRSAGTEAGARIKVTPGHLGWADVIVVMEKRHRERLRQKHPEALTGKTVVVLFIPDDFEFMAADLRLRLGEQMELHFPELRTQPGAGGAPGQ